MKVTKALEFRIRVVDALVETIERQVKLAEEELSRVRPEDFKEADLRTELMGLISSIEDTKGMAKNYKDLRKGIQEFLDGKEEEKVEGKPAFGFVSHKEAA